MSVHCDQSRSVAVDATGTRDSLYDLNSTGPLNFKPVSLPRKVKD